jgi:DNA-binding response OmpR family regulator
MAGFGLIKRMFAGAGVGDRRIMSREGTLKGAHVLVIDDSATIRAVLGKMLQQDGHVVLKAADGEAGIAMARSAQPDLVFLDIVMPGMNGFSVLRALRRDELTRDIPIVMISGNLQATEQFYVQRFGADDFMKKPFGRVEVFARIQHLAKSGRLSLRPRSAQVVVPAESPASEAEHAAIPDIAMPDLQDLLEASAAPLPAS